MIIFTGKHSGFCFGVKRAINEAEKLSGTGNFILGEIIHNESVNEKLKKNGVITVENLESEMLNIGDTLLIRTHGEPESTFIKAKEKGLNVIDCTCPFVKEIQKIVKEHYEKGYEIAIIGKKSHPEIIGINGWCKNTAHVCESAEELLEINAEKLCIVVQTTYSDKKFDEIIKKFTDSWHKTVDIFKTICYTTTERQKETELLARKCDAVIVLGGANSNNTNKLFEIANNICPNVFRVVSPSSFEFEKIKKFNKVGIVLGASTPNEQFQEVISNMEKVTEETVAIETVEQVSEEVKEVKAEQKTAKKSANVSTKSEMEKAFNSIRPSKDFRIGQVLTAQISSVKEDGLTLSLNVKNDYFELSKDEMLQEYNKDDYKDKIGQPIRVMVVGKNPVRLSEKAMQKVLKEEAEVEEIRNGKLFEAVVTATNKGGLTAKFGSYEVFIPASQIRMGFVKDLEKYVGKTLRLKAEKVESRGSRRQIVASQRVILEQEKAERDAIIAQKEAEFFGNVGVGDIVLGTPVRFASFGAFVEVNGFDCLAHISDLSWTGCNDCSEVLEIGKQYEFKVLKMDEETKRVSIGYKQLQPKPWDSVEEKYKVGDIIRGKVVRIVNFGAFVEVEKGIDGLVHVSQISNQWLENPVTALQVGQEIDAKIMDINVEKEKMTLSIKALLPEEPKPEKEEVKEETAKGKKRSKKQESEEEVPELREWKDDDGGVSIADMINENK